MGSSGMWNNIRSGVGPQTSDQAEVVLYVLDHVHEKRDFVAALHFTDREGNPRMPSPKRIS